jgi:group I intron endonuclease
MDAPKETTKKTTKEETLGLIYKVTAPNGRGYVGETIRTLSVRWNAHCQAASYCINLKRAILKYGRENMTLEVLEADVPFERLREREAHYIEQHGTLAPHGYNLRVGGGEKHRFSDETLEKMRVNAW